MHSRPTIRPAKSVPHLCSLPPYIPACPPRGSKINRDIKLIESPVSRSQQRPGAQIPGSDYEPGSRRAVFARCRDNRNISGTFSPAVLYPLPHSPFLIATPLRIERQPNSLKAKEKTFSNRNNKRSLAGQFFSSHSLALRRAEGSLSTPLFFPNFPSRAPLQYGNFPIRPREWSFSVGIPCCWERLACEQSRGRNLRERSVTRGRP
jgi:hypothetical protein